MKQNQEKHLVPLNFGKKIRKTSNVDLVIELEKPSCFDEEDLVVKKLLQKGGCGCVYNATYKINRSLSKLQQTKVKTNIFYKSTNS